MTDKETTVVGRYEYRLGSVYKLEEGDSFTYEGRIYHFESFGKHPEVRLTDGLVNARLDSCPEAGLQEVLIPDNFTLEITRTVECELVTSAELSVGDELIFDRIRKEVLEITDLTDGTRVVRTSGLGPRKVLTDENERIYARVTA